MKNPDDFAMKSFSSRIFMLSIIIHIFETSIHNAMHKPKQVLSSFLRMVEKNSNVKRREESKGIKTDLFYLPSLSGTFQFFMWEALTEN